MTLAPGTRFGHFEILSLLGAGGMGEVYRARDARLNRDVALKVLPDIFSVDHDRLARFEREAQVLASLSHANIGAIHGVEESQGRRALVLELVEGPTLADRIAEGPLPLDEALLIAKQIAEALEAAHEQGIVHRDLKPANVKLRADGSVKVLDFGLAKALDSAEKTSSSGSRPDVTASPTLLSPATMTSAGMILGTAAYMAPEQARGKAADRRADIWAFGCVLYEMVTGRRAFEGEEVTETLAAVLRGEPAWQVLPASTPRPIRRLLRRCLEKNPRERLQAIGDARLEIADALTGDPEAESAARGTPVHTWSGRIVPFAIVAVVTALLVAGATWRFKPAAPEVEREVSRTLVAVDPFDARPPAKPGELRPAIARTTRTALALSPDGRMLVFRANAGSAQGGWKLYLRPLDRLDAVPIQGTEGAENPFFSPDGASIAYVDGGELRKVPASGGSVAYTTIARLPRDEDRIRGASWGDNDVIVFATGEGLWRVPAAGGTPERISETGKNEYARALPHLLPGGTAILFTLQKTVFRWDDAQVVARSLATGEEKVLLTDAADARYVRSGHIVFVRRGRMMAVPFDPETLALAGAPVTIIDDVMQAINISNTTEDTGAAHFTVTPQGTLAYITGGIQPDESRELVWVDRDGTAQRIPAPDREYVGPRVSPDGQRIVAFTSASALDGAMRLWSYDLARGTSTPLTSADERALWPIWSPDGTRIAFQSVLAGRGVMSLRSADGAGAAQTATGDRHAAPVPSSWSRDGTIAFVDRDVTTGADIWVTTAGGPPQPVVQTPAGETYPAFSPDGKWLAYVSDVSGRPDVYVQPHPGPGPRVLVSPEGGVAPAWKADGSELFYYTGPTDGVLSMRSVSITISGSGIVAGTPRKLFEGRFVASGPARGYDVTADGRFVMIRTVDPPPAPAPKLVLVQGFFEELKRRVPAGNAR